MAGTAHWVSPDTAVALRYQVDRPASLAKLGYRRASTWLLEFSSEVTGNSSSRTITTGCSGLMRTPGALASTVPPGWGSTSLDTGEMSRKTRAKTSGAGARYRSHSLRPSQLAYSRPPATPPATPTATSP